MARPLQMGSTMGVINGQAHQTEDAEAFSTARCVYVRAINCNELAGSA